MDFVLVLQKVDSMLASVKLEDEIPNDPATEPSAQMLAAFDQIYIELSQFTTLNDVKLLAAGRSEFRSVKTKADSLCEYAANWPTDANEASPRNVNKQTAAKLARSRLVVQDLTRALNQKMAVAAEICEVESVFTTIDHAVSDCSIQLAELEDTAAAKLQSGGPNAVDVQIPETSSPQAPIYCTADIILNNKLSRLRFQCRALRRSLQYIPLRLDTLTDRAASLEVAYQSLCESYRQLDRRIADFTREFDALDKQLTHELWMPIIAHSKDPRVRNYAKIRGFCDPSPEKPTGQAIALFRGVRAPRPAIVKSKIPVIVPMSPPSFSSASDGHLTSASYSDSSDDERDFFTTSPLLGKGNRVQTLNIPRLRPPKCKDRIHKPTEIVKGQRAPDLKWKAPSPKPRTNSRVQAPTPMTIKPQSVLVSPPPKHQKKMDSKYPVMSAIPTVRCSSICTK